MLNLNRNNFVALWIAVVTVGTTLAIMGSFLTTWSVGELVERNWGETASALLVGALFGAILAIGTGVSQAIVLVRYGIDPRSWIFRTLVAGTLGIAIGMTLLFTFMDMEAMPEVLIGLNFGLSAGVPIGHAQSQLLKGRVAQPRLWILISTLAFAVGFAAGMSLSGEGREWLAIGTMSLVTAVITCVGLLWLDSRETTPAIE